MITNTTTSLEFKKTKAQIVQRLLEEKHINAEEAVTLLMSEKEPYIQPVPLPPQPYRNPYDIPVPLVPYYYSTTSEGTTTVPFSENQIQR
jgi:hypothetical protein